MWSLKESINTKSMLLDALFSVSYPQKFLALCCKTSSISHKHASNTSSIRKLSLTKSSWTLPNLTIVKVIGSLCYATTIGAHRSKFDHRAKKCALPSKIGLKVTSFLTWDQTTFFLSRGMQFYESQFPF